MDEIRNQVGKAHRRLVIQQFLNIFAWCLFAGLMIMAVGLIIPKLWYVGVDPQTWLIGWIVTPLVGAFATAGVWTYIVRRKPLDAAIELDLRYGLKERVSSTLSLAPDELDSEAARALIDDATHRVKRIDVRDEFRVGLDRKFALVGVPLAIIVITLLLGNADPSKANAANSNQLSAQQKKDMEEIGKRIIANIQKKKSTDPNDKDLKEADLELKAKAEKVFNDITGKKKLDPKNTLVKLSDLAKDIEKRREKFGGAEQMKKQMENLKNIDQGPADKIANAVKDGNLQKAVNEIKKLEEKMRNEGLNENEKKQLEKQLEQLQQNMEKMVDAHKQAKEELQQQIQQKMAQGDQKGAEQLQQKLDQMKMMDEQMQQMEQMAQQMGQCKECMGKNANGEAADQMQKMAQQLQKMQDELDQLEQLDEMLDDVQIAKKACANCQGGDGEGGKPGQMAGNGNGNGQKNGAPGQGMGQGRGQGERPEEENKTNMYNSEVNGDPKSAVITGVAGGPNKAGVSRESLKEAVAASLSKDADPIADQRLPKNQLNQTKDYFSDSE
ncbi:MAG: hypothetical protein ACI9HK_001393 [Pirellulaceae bacterium]|jgi:hypothetical protein